VSALVQGAPVPTTGKTNERPGTRAMARDIRMSASKARQVVDLIRGLDVASADEVLRFSERDAAIVVRKVLRSAIANAEHNDDQIPEDLFVAAAFVDEGKTLKRMRPRARGRASRILKRTCHITVIVARMPEREIERRRVAEASRPGSRAARRAGQQVAEERRRRIRRSRQAEAAGPELEHDHDHEGHDHDHEGHDHDHEGHDHDHEGHDHGHDEPTAEDVAIAAEGEAAELEGQAGQHDPTDHEVAEIESGNVELPADVGTDDQLPGGDPAAAGEGTAAAGEDADAEKNDEEK
jgi:large subunit ribosomal protein L22